MFKTIQNQVKAVTRKLKVVQSRPRTPASSLELMRVRAELRELHRALANEIARTDFPVLLRDYSEGLITSYQFLCAAAQIHANLQKDTVDAE